MKTIRNLVLCFFMFSFCTLFSCKDDINEIINESSESECATLSELARGCSPLQIIQKYVNQKCLDTRAQGGDISLESIEYEGQTVMYIANYPDGGFDIFSADYHAPMVLVNSETGSFVPSDTTSIPDGFIAFLDDLSKTIYAVSKTNGPVDNSWNFSNNRYPTIIDASIDFEYRVDRSMLGEGYWISDTVKVIRNTPIINHLVHDHWHQRYPFNQYIKYVSFNGVLDHGYVGCCTIALAEFLHYWYKRTGHAPTMYSTATYDSLSNTYIFSNPTNTIWSSLDNNIDSIAMVLGYISKCISTRTDNTGTASNIYKINRFLSDSCGISNSYYRFNESIIFNQINNFCPTIATASGECDGENSCHCFLIDACKNQQKAIAIRNRWFEPVDYGDHSISYNEYYNRYVEYKLLEINDNYFFKVNWGWGNSYYDELWLNGTTRWNLREGFYYDEFQQIIKIN